jgi:hypothetical protein
MNSEVDVRIEGLGPVSLPIPAFTAYYAVVQTDKHLLLVCATKIPPDRGEIDILSRLEPYKVLKWQRAPGMNSSYGAGASLPFVEIVFDLDEDMIPLPPDDPNYLRILTSVEPEALGMPGLTAVEFEKLFKTKLGPKPIKEAARA